MAENGGVTRESYLAEKSPFKKQINEDFRGKKISVLGADGQFSPDVLEETIKQFVDAYELKFLSGSQEQHDAVKKVFNDLMRREYMLKIYDNLKDKNDPIANAVKEYVLDELGEYDKRKMNGEGQKAFFKYFRKVQETEREYKVVNIAQTAKIADKHIEKYLNANRDPNPDPTQERPQDDANLVQTAIKIVEKDGVDHRARINGVSLLADNLDAGQLERILAKYGITSLKNGVEDIQKLIRSIEEKSLQGNNVQAQRLTADREVQAHLVYLYEVAKKLPDNHPSKEKLIISLKTIAKSYEYDLDEGKGLVALIGSYTDNPENYFNKLAENSVVGLLSGVDNSNLPQYDGAKRHVERAVYAQHLLDQVSSTSLSDDLRSSIVTQFPELGADIQTLPIDQIKARLQAVRDGSIKELTGMKRESWERFLNHMDGQESLIHLDPAIKKIRDLLKVDTGPSPSPTHEITPEPTINIPSPTGPAPTGPAPTAPVPTEPARPTKQQIAQVMSEAQAEKPRWWERNKEWIYWVIAIVGVSVLGFFAFRKGGWLNKDDDKKETSTSTNTNENTNSNENNNTNTDSNTNTGTNTDTGILESNSVRVDIADLNNMIANNVRQQTNDK